MWGSFVIKPLILLMKLPATANIDGKSGEITLREDIMNAFNTHRKKQIPMESSLRTCSNPSDFEEGDAVAIKGKIMIEPYTRLIHV